MLTGRAVSGAGPYRSLTEALMRPVRAGLVAESAALRPFRSALGRILPGWATGGGRTSPASTRSCCSARGCCGCCWRSRRRSGCWSLDDLQYADPDTLAVLEYLAPALTQLPILLVAGQGDWPPSPALNRMSTLPSATRLPLTRLTAAEVAAWVDGAATGAGRVARPRWWSGPKACPW